MRNLIFLNICSSSCLLLTFLFLSSEVFVFVDSFSSLNPKTDHIACGRPGPSWVCDPDSVITSEAADTIDGIIDEIQRMSTNCPDGGPQVGVALMNKMEVPFFSTAESFAKTSAKELHDRWGVGHEACQNGILFLLSKNDRQIYISTGAGVKQVLTDAQVLLVIEKMKEDLRAEKFSKAIVNAILDIKNILQGNPLSSYNHIMIYVYGVIISVVLMVWCCGGSGKYSECKHKLSLIERQAKAQRFDSSMCPICLEEFSSKPDIPKEILDCGHTFCRPCLFQWFNTNPTNNNKCPICRHPLDGVGVAGGGVRHRPESDFHNDLVFYLHSTHRLYPHYVTRTMINTWTVPSCSSYDFCSDPYFVGANPSLRSGRGGGGGSSFGGGSSSGGGGGGGSW